MRGRRKRYNHQGQRRKASAQLITIAMRAFNSLRSSPERVIVLKILYLTRTSSVYQQNTSRDLSSPRTPALRHTSSRPGGGGIRMLVRPLPPCRILGTGVRGAEALLGGYGRTTARLRPLLEPPWGGGTGGVAGPDSLMAAAGDEGHPTLGESLGQAGRCLAVFDLHKYSFRAKTVTAKAWRAFANEIQLHSVD